MIRLGLTGSIAMGKSTVAAMFGELGAAVHDSDAAVHALYRADGDGTQAIAQLAPTAIGSDGVDRRRLRDAIQLRPDLLDRIEAAIHPLVERDRKAFAAAAAANNAPLAVFDVPLLFEKGIDREMDVAVVVSAPYEVHRRRALSRPGMSEDAFEAILARQMPDGEKRRRADAIIDTSGSLEETRRQVEILFQRYGPGGAANA